VWELAIVFASPAFSGGIKRQAPYVTQTAVMKEYLGKGATGWSKSTKQDMLKLTICFPRKIWISTIPINLGELQGETLIP
jgi:hypothetical protein